MTEQSAREINTSENQRLKESISFNESQLAAVTHDAEHPLLVVAGPGSGKTRVIVERVKHLVTNLGISPSHILCLTFSEKAANEMRMRIEKEANTTEVEPCTYHSFCLGILEECVLDTGVSFKAGLISRANQLVWGLKNIDRFGFEHIEIGNNAVRIIEAIIDGISAFQDEIVSPNQLREYIEKKRQEYLAQQEQAELLQAPQAEGRQQASQESSDADAPVNGKKKEKKEKKSKVHKANVALEELQEKIAFVNKLSDLQKVYAQYEQYKRKESLIDFDDMIHIVIETFRRKPEVLKRYQERYDYVLVDEFQDNNYAQLELLKLLCPDGNITAVGDDDQSIYRFRGAYLTIFDDFQRHYSDKELKIVKLERNYRSTKNIVDLAKKLLDPIDRKSVV